MWTLTHVHLHDRKNVTRIRSPTNANGFAAVFAARI
jgi:hypothetical protein